MKIEKTFDIKYESVNFLEEHICDAIWSLLEENFDKLPKNAKVKLSMEFL